MTTLASGSVDCNAAKILPRDGELTVTLLARPGHGRPRLPVSGRCLPAPVAHSLDLMGH